MVTFFHGDITVCMNLHIVWCCYHCMFTDITVGMPKHFVSDVFVLMQIFFYISMTDTLEEAHRATMMNPRAAEMFGGLCQPGEKLVIFGWDSWTVKMQKPGNHRDQRATWSTKIHGNCMTRMEASDLEGKPVFKLCLGASTSPRATDESLSFSMMETEMVTGQRGGMLDMFVGLPGYCLVHLMDNGFR